MATKLQLGRTVAALIAASIVYVALFGPIGGLLPGWIAAGVLWYPGLFLSIALCFSFDARINWWRYPLFVVATAMANFYAVLLTGLDPLIDYPTVGLSVGSAFGGIAFCVLLRWIVGMSFLKWPQMLLLVGCVALASLIADVTAPLPVPQSYDLVSYTLFWWWSFVTALLWLQIKSNSGTRGHGGRRHSNKGFNRTLESSGPAKPGEFGAGAG